MQVAHSREKTIIFSAGEEKSGDRTGRHDRMLAASLRIERPGRRRLRWPEAPLLIDESADHADAGEPTCVVPSHIQRQITAKGEAADRPTLALERDAIVP